MFVNKLTNRLFVGVKGPIRQKIDELPFELDKLDVRQKIDEKVPKNEKRVDSSNMICVPQFDEFSCSLIFE